MHPVYGAHALPIGGRCSAGMSEAGRPAVLSLPGRLGAAPRATCACSGQRSPALSALPQAEQSRRYAFEESPDITGQGGQ